MTTEQFANQARTFLAAPLAPADTSLTVISILNFPTTPEFRIRIGQELLLVTGVTGNTWAVTRGAEGTSPAPHSQNAVVTAVLTAGALAELRAEIEAELLTAGSLATTTTSVVISGATAPTPGQVLTATSGTAAEWMDSVVTTLFAGSMTQTFRAGAGVPFPEYASLLGDGYITTPEPDLASQMFELTIMGSSGAVAVLWCDERHIGTHAVPAIGLGTLIVGALDVTLTYGAYAVHIAGNIAGPSFIGTATTTVGVVTEVHSVVSMGPVSSLTFPASCQYYSTAGYDANDGYSLKAPKRTLPIPVAGANYCLERRSVFGPSESFGNEAATFAVYDCGAGHRPVFNQFITNLVWTDAGSGAWTTTVHGIAAIEPETVGQPHCIVDGNLMQWVADLATVRTTPGSFAIVGSFIPTGSDVVVYLRPAAATNPNTDGHIYEVCTGELAIRSLGACTFRGIIGRGCTANVGVISCQSHHSGGGGISAAEDAVSWTNCDAHFGRKHNFGGFGGTFTNCISWKCQQASATEYSSHFVGARVGNDAEPVFFNYVNCACIGQPTAGVIKDESGILLELQLGTVPLGPCALDQLYCAYLAGNTIAQTLPVFPPSCVVNDLLVERLLPAVEEVIEGGKYVFNRARVYALGDYSPGLILTARTVAKLEMHNCLCVTGGALTSSGRGYIDLNNSSSINDPMIFTGEDNTFVRLGTVVNESVCINIDCTGTHNYGQITWNRNVTSGFGIYFETLGTVSVPPHPLRISSDFNSIGCVVNGNQYGFCRINVNAPYATWQAGDGIWAASDAHSVAGAVTFSNTTGRYPAYTKTSSGPGGYTATFLDPSTYLGVQFITALEAAGQYPA